MAKTYKVCLIGCGRMGATIDDEVRDRPHSYLWLPYSHAAGYVAVESTELVAVSDVVQEKGDFEFIPHVPLRPVEDHGIGHDDRLPKQVHLALPLFFKEADARLMAEGQNRIISQVSPVVHIIHPHPEPGPEDLLSLNFESYSSHLYLQGSRPDSAAQRLFSGLEDRLARIGGPANGSH